jgi:leucyl-tRNA synthetase
VSYPISFGGKVRLKLTFPADMPAAEVQAATLANPDVQKWMDGKEPKKVIVVPGRIVNIVL